MNRISLPIYKSKSMYQRIRKEAGFPLNPKIIICIAKINLLQIIGGGHIVIVKIGTKRLDLAECSMPAANPEKIF